MTTATQPTPYTAGVVDPVVRTAYEIFNAHDFAAIARVYHPDAELVNVATGQVFRGPTGVEEFMRGWIAAFGDAHIEIGTLVQAGDVAVCEFRGIGTHTGVLPTPMGDIAPTGRSVNVPFCDVIRLRGDKIASIHTYFDTATFGRQLQG
jgi:ketosteroid isomerase-like protein